MSYVELHAHSAYSFLDGASQPEELAIQAAELGYEALALTDHDGVYGSLEFAHAAKAFGLRPITGAEVTLADRSHVTLLVESPRGYANLCRLLTAAHSGTRRPGRETEPLPPSLDSELLLEHRGNRESVLLAPAAMAERFPDDFGAVARTRELAERLEFDLTQELGYRYPDFSDGSEPAIVQLRRVCEGAFRERYGARNGRARARLEEELALIEELGLAGFFLLHWEVLELARDCALEVRGPGSMRHVLPPGRGRGSSVGSLVCYLTGLSHVDPVQNELSLGRFLNRELKAVPDIDLDFPRDIREKLIVAVTDRYGREHAALVASFATYRSRGAIRDVGKALGLPYAELERLAKVSEGWNAKRVGEELQLLPDAERKRLSPRWRAFTELCHEIAGLPRHISQHPGGMVISSRPLVELVPVQPAAMAGRQLCQWDKDSCADAGFLKIDLLGLGMLSAVEECVEAIARERGETIDLSRIPLDDPNVFAQIQDADTVGD